MNRRKKRVPEKKEHQRDKGKKKQCVRKEGRSVQGMVGSKTNRTEGSFKLNKWSPLRVMVLDS